MDIKKVAELYFEKDQTAQELGETGQDTGDVIYGSIGDLLQQIPDETLAQKIDMLILEMSDADKREYFIKGFEACAAMQDSVKT